MLNLQDKRQYLMSQVKFLYDLQKLRIATDNRRRTVPESSLTPKDLDYLQRMATNLDNLEDDATRLIKNSLPGIPIYDNFLVKVKGCGPRMAGFLICETKIEGAPHPSSLWKWYGLHVKDGQAARRVRGQRSEFDPWRKSKVLKVLGECMIKAKGDYKLLYDDYKHRKETQMVPTCMCCQGTGRVTYKKEKGKDKEILGAETPESPPAVPLTPEDQEIQRELQSELASLEEAKPAAKVKTVTCWNCNGTGGPAPWGKSGKHRHQAAVRYMVKKFLADFWKAWRTLEGLPVTLTWAEQFQPEMHPVYMPDITPGKVSETEINTSMALEKEVFTQSKTEDDED